jgi:hypothetical protein
LAQQPGSIFRQLLLRLSALLRNSPWAGSLLREKRCSVLNFNYERAKSQFRIGVGLETRRHANYTVCCLTSLSTTQNTLSSFFPPNANKEVAKIIKEWEFNDAFLYNGRKTRAVMRRKETCPFNIENIDVRIKE